MNFKTAVEFLDWQNTLGPWDQWTSEQRDMRKAFFKSLPKEEKYLVQRERLEEFFTEENLCKAGGCGAPYEEMSPSGRYSLVVTSYGTKPGSWNYTRGVVTRVEDGQIVADVKRNYSSFWFTWLENHKNGHDYLVCGEDYQGSTFCELDTGRMRTEIPDAAFEGAGWCWTDADVMPDGITLRADGCFWACPYEYRFFDISDPMSGWEELSIPEGLDSLDYGENSSVHGEGDFIIWTNGDRVFLATGERADDIEQKLYTIWSQKRKAERAQDQAMIDELAKAEADHELKYPDEDEDKVKWGRVVDHRIVLRREKNKLLLVEEWKSEWKLESERRWKEYNEKSKAERQKWKNEDPLLDVLAAHIGGDNPLDGLVSFSYPSVMMKEEGDTNPAYFLLSGRKYNPEKSYNNWVEIAWGVANGDVNLENHTRGQGTAKITFPRTPAGIVAAWESGQAHLTSEFEVSPR